MSRKSARIAAELAEFGPGDFDPHYLAYFKCFNEGRFYQAHDFLEQLWLQDRSGPNGSYFKGLIQLAGAFVHLQKNRLQPAASLFKLARANMQKYGARHLGVDLDLVRQLIHHWLESLEQAGGQTNPLSELSRPSLALPSKVPPC